MKITLKKKGFTLVEVLTASLIATFLVALSVGALKTVSVTSSFVENNFDTASQLRSAVKKISTDLANFYRDSNSLDVRFIGQVQEMPDGKFCSLTMYAVGRTQARANQPESDVYEVEYFISKNEGKSLLMRRLWPNPNKDWNPGGILTVVAENIELFSLRYFDSKQWYDQWPEDMKAFPDLVEVTLAAKGSDNNVAAQSFIAVLRQAASAQSSQSAELITQQTLEQSAASSAGTQSAGTNQTGF